VSPFRAPASSAARISVKQVLEGRHSSMALGGGVSMLHYFTTSFIGV